MIRKILAICKIRWTHDPNKECGPQTLFTGVSLQFDEVLGQKGGNWEPQGKAPRGPGLLEPFMVEIQRGLKDVGNTMRLNCVSKMF